MPTISEVAKLAGVCNATVSRCFNMPTELRKETRDRVLEVANRLNYRPAKVRASAPRSVRCAHRMARYTAVDFHYFSASPSDTLATDPHYSQVFAGALDEADRLRLNVVLSSNCRSLSMNHLPGYPDQSEQRNMVIVGAAARRILDQLLPRIRHAVLIDACDEAMRFDSVISDGFGGAYRATKHLIELGHRTIGFFTTDVDEPPMRDRLYGYVTAHFDSGSHARRENILVVGSDDKVREPLSSARQIRDSLVAEVVDALRRPDRPTAYVCANDVHAIILMRACRELGIAIPSEMSVIGFDDSDLCVDAYPPLTTVAVNKMEVGRVAMRRIDLRIAATVTGQPQPPAICQRLPVEFVVRSSTAPPASLQCG